ncbi:MAG: C25 family cysteine peptidase [Bacteroidales bacterium]
MHDVLQFTSTKPCEFSRYDDVEIDEATGAISKKPSAGEMVLPNPDGGGIALLTTTRIVYSAPNFTLNNQLYQYAFTRDSEGEALSLGEILRLAKNTRVRETTRGVLHCWATLP